MKDYRRAFRVFGWLLSLPVLVGYVLAAFVMAALLIALTNEPVFKVEADRYSSARDSCLVELEVNKLRAEGKVELPGVGEITEAALFAEHKGWYYTAPHIYCGEWELKITPTHAGCLAGVFGCSSAGNSLYRYTGSPGEPYDGPFLLLGRQHGQLIDVLEIADCSGYYRSHMVTDIWWKLCVLSLCAVAVFCMAGLWWLFCPYSRPAFLPVCLICLSLLLLPAAILVGEDVVVHAGEASFWAVPLALAVALAGGAYAIRQLIKLHAHV